jgi:hypothetical protein
VGQDLAAQEAVFRGDVDLDVDEAQRAGWVPVCWGAGRSGWVSATGKLASLLPEFDAVAFVQTRNTRICRLIEIWRGRSGSRRLVFPWYRTTGISESRRNRQASRWPR